MYKSRFEFEEELKGGKPFISDIRRNLSYDIPHYHSELEIVYVKEGTLRAVCDVDEYIAEEKEFFIFMPGTVHSFNKSQKNAIYYAKIPPPSTNECESFSALRLPSALTRRTDPLYKILEPAINMLFAERENMLSGYELAILRYSSEILEKLFREGGLVKIPKEEQTRIAVRLTLLRDVDDFIEENFHERIELDAVARACGYSKYYFAHFFKEATQMSFYSYLTVFRLKKAVSAIRTESKSITEIAHEYGFGSVRSFNRMFRKYYSVSPTEFMGKQ